tara:strand:- start:461 stop:718 length:258 start_codon:yes stop_codon:yes gene_type:complete
MSESNTQQLTGFDLWTPNDYSNFITICAAAVGSTLLVVFKSRCKNIKLCCGIVECVREPAEQSDDEDSENPEPVNPPLVPPVQNP